MFCQVSEMIYRLLSLVFQVTIVSALCLYCCEGTSITLSPLGMVLVCPGGQVLLTCERMSGSFLFWTVSVPRLTTRDTIVADQGGISTTDLQFNGLHPTAFNITRTFSSPLTSQMMVNNVTDEMNGSTIYCSEDRNTNGAPAVTLTITNQDHPFNVTLVNNFLRNSVTVTLRWPRETGAVYSVEISPEISYTSHSTSSTVIISLTISYDVQYNMSIESSLCGVTTTKVLKYVTCDLPTQLLGRTVVVNTGSQEIPHREGQFITYTCPHGLVLTDSNASVCTGNREWEPDPGVLDCIADCGVPRVNSNVKQNSSSTLEGSVLILTCENEISSIMNVTNEEILSVTCHSSGNWIPDPSQFTCSPSGFTWSTLLIIILSGVIFIFILLGLLLIIICVIKRKCVVTKTPKTSKNDLQSQEPMYDEVSDTHLKGIQMKGNAAYSHMIQTSQMNSYDGGN